MMSKYLIGSLVFTILNCTQLPSSFKTCNHRKPDYNLCLKAAVQDALKQLENPIPDLDLPSIKSLKFANKTNRNHHSEAYSIEEKLENVLFYDFTTAQVLNFDVDFEEHKIFGLLAMDVFYMELNISFNGESYSEPVHFKGSGLGNLDNTKLNITATFEVNEKEGKKYINILVAQVLWTYSSGNFRLKSDNEGEINHFEKLLKLHAKEMFAVVKPDYEALMALAFVDYGNRVFSKISATDMFGLY